MASAFPTAAGSTAAFALGTRVELLFLDDLEFNGLQGSVVGPLVKGRHSVEIEGHKVVKIKLANIRAVAPDDAPYYIGGRRTTKTTKPTAAELTRQCSVGKDYNKDVSYLYARCDFERVPRWPGDGIEQCAEEMRGMHTEFSNKCKRQKKYERIMGGWPSAAPLRNGCH